MSYLPKIDIGKLLGPHLSDEEEKKLLRENIEKAKKMFPLDEDQKRVYDMIDAEVRAQENEDTLNVEEKDYL